LRFFLLSPSAPEPADFAVFFAALLASEDLAGALEAVDTGAFPAVEAGFGAISKCQTWTNAKGLINGVYKYSRVDLSIFAQVPSVD